MGVGSSAGQPDAVARRLWEALEPVHAQVYFAAEPRLAMAATGLRGFWMGYVASRSAAMGRVSPAVVEATFYNFHPALIRRAVPDAWALASPEEVLAARQQGATASLTRLLGAEVSYQAVLAVSEPVLEVMASADLVGRPLFAAHVALTPPADPVGRLWFAATLLREHRGDGHVAALVTEGIGGCAAHVLAAARGATDGATQRDARQWTVDDWAAATRSLIDRGLMDGEDRLSRSGYRLAHHLEVVTDRRSSVVLRLLAERTRAVVEAAERLALAVLGAGGVAFPNAMAYARTEWADS